MLIPGLGRVWEVVLYAGFSLLCLRFLVAATRETYPDVLPVFVLTAGSLGLSAWRPRSALFAFTISVPLLNGLGYVGLAGLPAPVSLVFAGVFVGWILRQIASWAKGEKRKAEGVDLPVRPLNGQDSKTVIPSERSGQSNRQTAVTVKRYSTVQLTTDILTTVVLVSLIVQIWRHHDAAGFWKVCWSRPVFGFGDPFYFMTSAFLWLQGLFFFRMLIEGAEEWGSAGARDKGEGQGAESKARSAGGGAVTAWIKPAFTVYGVTLAIFYLLQVSLHIPEPYVTWAYYPDPSLVGFNMSPYEDISSFGSIAVAVFVFVIASWQKKPWAKTALYGICVIGLLVLVAASWSRATWLAGGLILLLVAWIRLSKRWIAALVGLGTIAVIILNVNANRDSWNQNPYLWRLITLVRVENLTSKSPERINLYQKAVGMIREHPFVGYGIGSIYLTSVRYARPGDPGAAVPGFAHNVFLQVAAEQGVPAAALFAALVVFALWKGFRKWKAEGEKRKAELEKRKAESEDHDGKTDRQSNGQPVDGSTVGRYHGTTEDGLTILGVTMALTAYLFTQMTANSLNVYLSNQFFFWFLMAALLCGSDGHKEAQESQILKVE